MVFINKCVSEIMTSNTITVGPFDNLIKVREIFDENNIHHIPVVNDENQLLGMVSITDYATSLNSKTAFGNIQTLEANERNLKSILASDIMSKNVVTLSRNHFISAAIDIFKENLFHSIPIVNENQELEGLVTTFDIMIELSKAAA